MLSATHGEIRDREIQGSKDAQEARVVRLISVLDVELL